MMSSIDDAKRVFDRVFKSLGGVAPLPSGPSRLAKLLGYYMKRCQNAVPDQSFHFDFVKNQRINACATTDAGFNLIGFNLGTPVGFLKLYETLLSNPEILPHVGDPSKDPKWECDLSKKDLQDGFADIFPPAIERITADPSRAAFVHHCTQFAMDFIFWHEIFHVLCGHVGYCLNCTHHGAGLAELEGRPTLEAATSQALELEADMNAAALTGSIWLQEPLLPGVPFRGSEEALRTWAFSLAVVFLIFDQARTRVRDYRDSTHPHPAIRAAVVFNTVAGIARKTAHQEAVVDRAWEKNMRDCQDLTRLLKLRPAWLNAWENEPDTAVLSTEFLVDHLESIQAYVMKNTKPPQL
jgi:hypothetical protein